MFQPLVSIIIPVYNGSKYMREAIDSAIAQSYPNIEIIVVNDGSADQGETERIALSYGEQITYYKKQNGGCASALNFGISKMHGEYFSWLSHDDVYFPDKISAQIQCIIDENLKPDTTVVACRAMIINDHGHTLYCTKARLKGLLDPAASFTQNILYGSFNGCSLLIPKNVLACVGNFDTNYTYILDQACWTRISLHGFYYYNIDRVLVKNRRHSGQVSVHSRNLLESETDRLMADLAQELRHGADSPGYRKTLYYFCETTGRKDTAKIIYDLLKEKKQILLKDRVIINKFKTKRKILGIIKRIYKSFFLKI